MTDIVLAQVLAGLLAPFLPYLGKAAQKGVEAIGTKAGEAAWRAAQGVWRKLQSTSPQNAEQGESEEVVTDQPLSESVSVFDLVTQIEAILRDNPELEDTLRGLLGAPTICGFASADTAENSKVTGVVLGSADGGVHNVKGKADTGRAVRSDIAGVRMETVRSGETD